MFVGVLDTCINLTTMVNDPKIIQRSCIYEMTPGFDKITLTVLKNVYWKGKNPVVSLTEAKHKLLSMNYSCNLMHSCFGGNFG